MKIYIQAFLLIAAAILFSSCIGMQRQIKLNADGSGSEKMTLVINRNSIMAMQVALSSFDNDSVSNAEDLNEIEDLFKDTTYLAEIRRSFNVQGKTDSLKLVYVKEIASTDSTKTIQIYFKFTNVKHLFGDKLKLQPDDEISEDQIKSISPAEFKLNEDDCEFTYKLGKNSEADTLQQYDSLKVAADKILETVFGKGTLTFEIITENDIIETNADSRSGKKVSWFIPFIDFVKKQKLLKVKFSR